MEHSPHARRFFYLCLLVIVTLGVIFLKPYLSTLALALLLAFLFHPVYAWLFARTGRKTWIAAPLTFLAILLAFIVPLGIAISLTVQVVTDFAHSTARDAFLTNPLSIRNFVDQANLFLSHVPQISYRLSENDLLSRIQELGKTVQGAAWHSVQGLGSTISVIIPTFFITIYTISAGLTHYKKISQYLHRLSPLDDSIDRLYAKRITSMIISIVRGTFLIALIQGVVTGLSFWIAGVPYAAFFGLVATIISIIPLGSGALVLPIAIYLGLSGQLGAGIFLAAVNIILTTNLDNVLRPRLIKKEASLHPALVLIGLFTGLAHFGFLGIVYGPVFMVILVTTIDLYREHFAEAS